MRISNTPKPSNIVSCCIILDLHHVFPHSCETKTDLLPLVLSKGNYQLSILLRDSKVKIMAFIVFIYLFFCGFNGFLESKTYSHVTTCTSGECEAWLGNNSSCLAVRNLALRGTQASFSILLHVFLFVNITSLT